MDQVVDVFLGKFVERSGRLVKQHNVRIAEQGEGDKRFLKLAARKVADRRFQNFRREADCFRGVFDVAPGKFFDASLRFKKVFEIDRQVTVGVDFLGDIGDLRLRAPRDRTPMGIKPQEGFQKHGLSRAVRADDRKRFACIEVERDVF